MRNPNRIPICMMDYFRNVDILQQFLQCDRKLALHIYSYSLDIEKFWKQNPDLRFGQLLCVMRLIPDLELENRIWNIEETTWLVEKGYCNYEDINFWGVNFFKTGKPRKKTKFVLLKDLTTDHIANIILWFENQNALQRIPSKYLEYFKKRIDERIQYR